jgi:hypothetical protein
MPRIPPNDGPPHKADCTASNRTSLRRQGHGWTLAWLPDPPGGRWYELGLATHDNERSRIRMPYLTPATSLDPLQTSLSTGDRPSLAERDPAETEAVATLIDVLGWSLRAIAEQGHVGTLAARRHHARRLRDRGRERLHELGVLPWTVFVGGVPRDWERSSDVTRWLGGWRLYSRTFPPQS